MPNRILKESIVTSENIELLSPEAETFFYRLIVNCDDFGRADARPNVLLAKCFPLKIGKITIDEIVKYVMELVEAGLVKLYKNGHEYLQLVSWETHQQVRAKKSKHPSADDISSQVLDINCYQLQSDVIKCSRNPIQSNPNPNRNPNPNPRAEKNLKSDASESVREFIARYCEEFRNRYGSNPDITGKDAGIAKRLVKDLGIARALALARAYVEMNDSFFLTKRHDLVTFESNLKAIAVKLDTGQSVNRTQARQQETRDANVEAAQAYLALKGMS